MPQLLVIFVLVSIVLFLIPQETIVKYLGGDNLFVGFIMAVFFGSITMMPGFVTFPLCGILLQQGAAYMVLSAFSTTLMMVGIMTYKLESSYFGHKVTIIRNIIGLFIALVVAVVTGILYGEIL